jgi:NADPH:quinone reductase-like Zn-dependent oxidoreductase
VGTTTSTGNVDLVRSLGADEVVDYKNQEFETVLRGYDAALGTVRGDTIEKSIGILKARGRIVSLVGPLDVAFARARRLNVFLTFVFALMSRKIMRLTKKRHVDYSFLFARPDGDQLAQIGKLLEAQRIRRADAIAPVDPQTVRMARRRVRAGRNVAACSKHRQLSIRLLPSPLWRMQ